MDEFSSQIKGREAEVRQEYAQNNSFIIPITTQVRGEAIEGIISCMEKRELKDFIRQQAVAIVGSVLKKATGSGLKEEDNNEYYYLALTPQKLHYIHYSEEGKCQEHLSFSREQMQELEVGTVTSGEAVKNSALIGDSTRISFIFNETQYKFFFYNKLHAHPQGHSAGSIDKEMAEINYLFAKPFKEYAETLRK